MSITKIKVSYSQVGKLLKGSEVKEMLEAYADKICDKAGEGYSAEAKKKSTRYIAEVSTESYDAMRDNSRNNTLLKALGEAQNAD